MNSNILIIIKETYSLLTVFIKIANAVTNIIIMFVIHFIVLTDNIESIEHINKHREYINKAINTENPHIFKKLLC